MSFRLALLAPSQKLNVHGGWAECDDHRWGHPADIRIFAKTPRVYPHRVVGVDVGDRAVDLADLARRSTGPRSGPAGAVQEQSQADWHCAPQLPRLPRLPAARSSQPPLAAEQQLRRHGTDVACFGIHAVI